jgi:predicted AAA+ superfamily ATPase
MAIATNNSTRVNPERGLTKQRFVRAQEQELYSEWARLIRVTLERAPSPKAALEELKGTKSRFI